MLKKITSNRNFVKYIIASVVLGLAVGLLCNFKAFFSLDALVTDKIFLIDRNVNNLPIYILGIDETTLQDKGAYLDWDRSVYGDLINVLYTDEYEPAVVTFDILFTGNKTEEGDKKFVEACSRHNNIIVGSCIDYDKAFKTDSNGKLKINHQDINSITYPFSDLNAVVDSAFTNTSMDTDGVIRYSVIRENYNGQYIDSLALATYRKYCEYWDLEDTFDYSEITGFPVFFSYTDKPENIVELPLSKVLDGTINPAEFDGAIVMIGAYAEGLFDDFKTPIDRKNNMYGVAIHSQIIKAIDSGRIQIRTDEQTLVSSIIYGVLSAIILFVLFYCTLPVGGAIAGGMLVLLTVVCYVLYRKNLYLSYIYPALAILLSYVAMIFIHYISVRMEKAKINNAFKMYVSPQVVEEVAKSGTYELKLGGETKDIACLFIDIRGFTTMSEGLDPETVVEILNEYFAVITDAIFKNGGTLDKFIGDAAMAVFNSPFDLDDYEMRAVRSALDIAANSEKLRNKLMERFGRTVNYGIGINCGPATVGNIGCDFRMDFTAIGDTVNTASRLESNAKAGQILISEAMYERVGDRIVAEDVGGLSLKGKANVIHTFNVLSVKEE